MRIGTGGQERTFTDEECATLDAITNAFTPEQRETYFNYCVYEMHVGVDFPTWPKYEGDGAAYCRALWELGFQISIIDGPINFGMDEEQWEHFEGFFSTWGGPERVAFHEVTCSLYHAAKDAEAAQPKEDTALKLRPMYKLPAHIEAAPENEEDGTWQLFAADGYMIADCLGHEAAQELARALNASLYVPKAPSEITVRIEKGLVSEVLGIPPGLIVAIHDYDTHDMQPGDDFEHIDADGDVCRRMIYETGDDMKTIVRTDSK